MNHLKQWSPGYPPEDTELPVICLCDRLMRMKTLPESGEGRHPDPPQKQLQASVLTFDTSFGGSHRKEQAETMD